jgi:DNA uptake protein ComE-like DNA-binding protein
LGGFASVDQLKEVYGIDAELYSKISPYIKPDGNYSKININKLEFKQLLSHPYLNYKQVKAIVGLRDRKGKIASINELSMLDEFTTADIERLTPYLEFE